MLKYTNTTKTAAQFNGASFSLAAPEDFASIGDGPTRDAVLKWIATGNVPTLADVPSAAFIKATNIKKIDADVDAIYEAAIGNRATEYSEAEAQATAFKAVGYTGAVPAYVASWLSNNTKAFTTATQAADDIIAQANAWRSAAAAIRSNRLLAKKNLTNDVATAMASWDGFVVAIRSSMGI